MSMSSVALGSKQPSSPQVGPPRLMGFVETDEREGVTQLWIEPCLRRRQRQREIPYLSPEFLTPACGVPELGCAT
jgi:hypothetical protein